MSLLLFIAERTINQKANGLVFLWVAEFFVGVSSEQLQPYPRNIMQYCAGMYFIG